MIVAASCTVFISTLLLCVLHDRPSERQLIDDWKEKKAALVELKDLLMADIKHGVLPPDLEADKIVYYRRSLGSRYDTYAKLLVSTSIRRFFMVTNHDLHLAVWYSSLGVLSRGGAFGYLYSEETVPNTRSESVVAVDTNWYVFKLEI